MLPPTPPFLPYCGYAPACYGIGDSGPTPFDPTSGLAMPTFMISDPSQWLCAGMDNAQTPDHSCKTDGSVVIQAAGACPAMCGAKAAFLVSGSTGSTAAAAGTPIAGQVDCTDPAEKANCTSQTAACSDFAGTAASWSSVATPDAPYAVPSFLNEVSACARSQPACAPTQPAG